MESDNKDIVFISYAREDREWAERLYMDLRKHEINAWLDVRSLKAGADWQLEIRKTIKKSRYFLLLLSKNSINKRGFIQREIRQGIDALSNFPKGEIFLIPIKLDNTEPIDEELQALNWVHLFPNYHDGLARILSSLDDLESSPLVVSSSTQAPTNPVKIIDKGREVSANMPLVLGNRASISYAPFRTAKEFLQQFFDRLPTDSIFADKQLSYYLTFQTDHPLVVLGDDVAEKYPEHIVVVLQNTFRELTVREHGVSVILSFNGLERTVAIPFEAIKQIQIPEIGITISFAKPPSSSVS